MSQPLGYDKNLLIPCHVVDSDRDMISRIIDRALNGKNTYIRCCSTAEAAGMFDKFAHNPVLTNNFIGTDVSYHTDLLIIEFHIRGCGFIQFDTDPFLRGNTAEGFHVDEISVNKKNLLVNDETIDQADDAAIEEAIGHAVYGKNVFVKCKNHKRVMYLYQTFKMHPLINDLINMGNAVRFFGQGFSIDINGSRIKFFSEERDIRGIQFDNMFSGSKSELHKSMWEQCDEPSIDKYNTFAVMSEAISGHWTGNNPMPFIPIKEEAPKKESNPIREAMLRWEAKHGKEV